MVIIEITLSLVLHPYFSDFTIKLKQNIESATNWATDLTEQ